MPGAPFPASAAVTAPPLGKLAGICKNPRVGVDDPAVAELGIRETFCPAAAEPPDIDTDIHFAFGDAAKGTTGFRVTHQQALAAQAVALASGSPAPRAVTFSQVAPVAMMLASKELLRPWVLSTLALQASRWLGSYVLRAAATGRL
jgi:hypothetical protein